MATTVNWDALRQLAAFRATKGCAISFYLGLDPSVTPTAGDAATRLRSLLSEGGRSDGADGDRLSHDQRMALKADFERIEAYFENEFDRDGTQGLVIFASQLDDLWSPIPLATPVDDEVRVAKELHLAPLVPLVGRGEGALVAHVGRERGTVYRLRGGRLEEEVEQFDEQPGQHDQGGWSQARFQRRIENLVHEHLKAVGEQLDDLVRRDPDVQVVFVAPEEMRAEILSTLGPETEKAIVGWTHVEAHATPAEILEAVTPELEHARLAAEEELLARWQEETGQGARASSGWHDTLAAASDGRVETLLVKEGANREAFRCPQCGRAAADAGACPLDGTTMEPDADGLDLAVHQTLTYGGTVKTIQFRPDLDQVDGIGALLRF